VTGEKELDSPQPAGRRPAPKDLALLQAFLNTHHDLAGQREVLRDPHALAAWLTARSLVQGGVRLDRADLDRALAVREGLRALAFANNHEALDVDAVDAMRRASEGAATEIRIEPGGPRFLPPPGRALDGALGVLLAIAASSMLDGTWRRLKACPAGTCRWVFYDYSRNQTARWCSMKVCGDREKARAYYQRRLERQE